MAGGDRAIWGAVDLTAPVNVLQYKQENGKATERPSGLLEADRDRRMWLELRRAMFVAIQAIERRYDMPLTKAGRE